MLKMAAQIETIISTYKTLSKIPSVASGRLNNAGNKVTATWSVRNLDRGKSTKYTTSYTLDDGLRVIGQSEFGADVSNELLSAISPKETYKAIIREEKNGKDIKKQYLEVWRKSTLAHCIDLTALDLHGDVYADSEFGNLDWNQDESKIVYVAEKKPPKFEPYIKRKGESKSKCDECSTGDSAPKKGEKFVYRQDWGEQLVGKHQSVIVVCALADETLTVLDHLPSSSCPGQVRFSADGASVIGAAWKTEPRRLGLIYCTNRPSSIFSLTLNGTYTKLSGKKKAVRSPRLSPRGSLLWLQRAAGGPHHACHQLVLWREVEEEVVPIIDIVDTAKQTTSGESFYGLYNQALPRCCFSEAGDRLVFSTPQENEVRSYVVDIGTGSITDISMKTAPGSTVVLDVKSDVILATYSSLTSPDQIYVARLPPKGSEASISWVRVSEAENPPPITSGQVEYLPLTHHGEVGVNSFSAIYFAPDAPAGTKLPLVVWPHGGPHSGFVNVYGLDTAMFHKLGFALLRCNYRGSTGAGDKSVRSLIGQIGNYDVADCYLALTTVLERDSTSHVVLNGGSYGGLVVGHLAAEHPDLFRAMAMRNPLIDLATKGYYADNSDGCAVEAGFEYTEKGPLSDEELLLMRRCSPLAHVHKVRAPTAMMLGSGDKRVPYYQGLDYVRRLKANGVETKVYVYDDNHSLATLAAEMDNLINSAHWFLTHLE